MKQRRFSLNFCRVVYKRAARAGCHCISCDWRRSTNREWHRDQALAKTPYYHRQMKRCRERDGRGKDFARMMYDHLRQMVRREGLWA